MRCSFSFPCAGGEGVGVRWLYDRGRFKQLLFSASVSVYVPVFVSLRSVSVCSDLSIYSSIWEKLLMWHLKNSTVNWSLESAGVVKKELLSLSAWLCFTVSLYFSTTHYRFLFLYFFAYLCSYLEKEISSGQLVEPGAPEETVNHGNKSVTAVIFFQTLNWLIYIGGEGGREAWRDAGRGRPLGVAVM